MTNTFCFFIAILFIKHLPTPLHQHSFKFIFLIKVMPTADLVAHVLFCKFTISILDKDTALSNLSAVETVDAFRYTVTSSSIAGTFLQGYMMTYYSSPAVPAGWLVPLTYVRDMAHVRLIIPSKMGHQTAMQYVYPYYYDIRKYQIWK